MAFFKYKVKNQHGETVFGKIESKNQEQAVSVLRGRDLLVISIRPAEEDGLLSFLSLNSVSQDDIVKITRQLSTMITAGLPLTDGLTILQQQSKKGVSKMIGEIIREIENGSTFAKALKKQDKYFSNVFIQLVRAGEIGGVLDEILQRLADDLEKSKEFRGKTRGALIYPGIVMAAMVIVISVMMIFVVPKLSDMYKDFGADLPFVTQLLINISNFFVKFWWLMIAGIVGGILGLKSWIKTEKGKRAFDKAMLKMPLFGKLRQKVILTDFTRTLSMLLGAGISLLEAMEVVNDAIENKVYNDILSVASGQVEKGVALAQSIGNDDKLFPPILRQMIAVGEQTGKLDEVLLKLSNYFQSETEQAVKNLTTAMEPMLMIFLGAGVGTIMIAILMPIYSLTSQF